MIAATVRGTDDGLCHVVPVGEILESLKLTSRSTAPRSVHVFSVCAWWRGHGHPILRWSRRRALPQTAPGRGVTCLACVAYLVGHNARALRAGAP